MIETIKRTLGRAEKPLTEVRVSIYGFRGESGKVINEFRAFFQTHKDLKAHPLLINFPEARVSDLMTDNNDIDYITIKCSNDKVLKSIKKKLIKDANLKHHFIDYQQPVSFATSKKD